MIVVAIIGILAAIAIPAYQDYTDSREVTEGLTAASAAKASIAERTFQPAHGGLNRPSRNAWAARSLPAYRRRDMIAYGRALCDTTGAITVDYHDIARRQRTLILRARHGRHWPTGLSMQPGCARMSPSATRLRGYALRPTSTVLVELPRLRLSVPEGWQADRKPLSRRGPLLEGLLLLGTPSRGAAAAYATIRDRDLTIA